MIHVPGAVRLLLTLIGVGLLILILNAMATLLNPILIGVTVALVCLPIVYWLKHRGVPTPFAVFLVIIGLLVVGLFFVGLVGISLSELSDNLPVYQARLMEAQIHLNERLAELGLELTFETGDAQLIDSREITQFVGTILTAFSRLISQSLLILGITIFAIIEGLMLAHKLQHPTLRNRPWLLRFNQFSRSLREYLLLKTWISLITAIVVLIFLGVMRIDFLLLWALLAFVLNYIPSIGSILAAIPAVFVALVQYDIQTAAIVASGYWIINYAIGWGIEPRMMGRGLNLSILTVFLSLIIWTWVLGPAGMFLSIPLTVFVKFILEGFEETHRFALLLSDRPTAPPPAPSPAILPRGPDEQDVGNTS